MEIIKKVVNGNNYELLCSCGARSGGFYHACILFRDGVQISDSRCNYCNRTWESYTYQTAMIQAVKNRIESHKIEEQELNELLEML